MFNFSVSKKNVFLIGFVVLLPLIALLILKFQPTKLNLKQKEPVQTETGTNVAEENTKVFSYEERMERGDYYAKNAFLSLAVNEYTQAFQLQPKLAEPYFQLGKSYLFLGNFEKAQENFVKASELEPDNQKIQIFLSKNFIKQTDFVEAGNVLNQIENKEPEAEYYVALLKILDNQTEEAQKILENLLNQELEPKLKENIHTILNSYTEYALFKGGKPIHLKTLLAKSLNQVKEYEIAINLLKEILKEKVDYRDAWILAGYAYLNLGKYDFALDSFRKAYDLDSEKPETQYFLGLTYFELGKIDDALTYLNIALKNGFEPQIRIKQKLADIYLTKKDYQKSLELYEEILNLNHDDINTYIRPIWINIEFLHEYDKALELAQKAYKTHPKDAMTFNLLAWTHISKKEYVKAEEYLNQAIKINPNLQGAWYNFGRVYEGTQQKEKALEAYQKAYELGKDSAIGNLAAQAYNLLYSE